MRTRRSLTLSFSLLSLVTTACSSSDPPDAPPAIVRPAPVVNEQKDHDVVYKDPGYAAEVVSQFRTTDVLPDLDVKSLALWKGDLYAGTATGAARLPAGADAFEPFALDGSGPVIDIYASEGGEIIAARPDRVVVAPLLSGSPYSQPFADGDALCAAASVNFIYVGTQNGLFRMDTQAVSPTAVTGVVVRDISVVLGGILWLATDAGVLRYDPKSDKLLSALKAPASLVDNDVRALAASSDGTYVLAATAGGLARIDADGGASTLIKPGLGVDALPNADLRAVASFGGETLTGHAIGATALSMGHKDHYHSERWIPAEEVTAVAIGMDRTRFLATPKGVSRISLENRTLAGKADAFEPLNERHWRMDGFVDTGVNVADPHDPESPTTTHDNDNDGLWTEMQVAAWCFAYASTGDEHYYTQARKAMDTILLLFDVPGETFAAAGKARGFISRSLVRDDEGALFDSKAMSDRWVKQEHDGRTYYWKNDTSSDEYAGHYFGIPIFYDLCAKTDEERQAIRERIDLATGYIVDNGDLLIDLDGEPTTFGRWRDLGVAADGDLGACIASGKEGCFESYGGGGWLNSIEILGHLLAAWHITGNPRYYDEYERLAVKERYAEMIPIKDHTFTVTTPSIENHSDHELATLAYYTLLRYEPSADRRAIWIKSIRDFYDYEREERNPFELAVIASAAQEDIDTAGAIQTLQELGVDWRIWDVDSSHRMDAELDVPDRFDNPQWKTVFPYDEIRTLKWNTNPHAVSDGSGGKEIQAPWPYLLPYWMMRYYGVITAP